MGGAGNGSREGPVSSAVFNITFDCLDPSVVSEFWAAVTAYSRAHEAQPGNDYWVLRPPDGNGPRLVFVTVPARSPTKNPVHLDLVPRDLSQEDEVARLVALGASVVDDRRLLDPGGWVVLADPEGNEFCVEHGGY